MPLFTVEHPLEYVNPIGNAAVEGGPVQGHKYAVLNVCDEHAKLTETTAVDPGHVPIIVQAVESAVAPVHPLAGEKFTGSVAPVGGPEHGHTNVVVSA